MNDIKKLSDNEIDSRLQTIEGWTRKNDTISKEFVFDDFVAAFGFMTKVAMVAESMNHHPDWSNAYKKVGISLSTHEVSGISELDFSLAEKIDRLA